MPSIDQRHDEKDASINIDGMAIDALKNLYSNASEGQKKEIERQFEGLIDRGKDIKKDSTAGSRYFTAKQAYTQVIGKPYPKPTLNVMELKKEYANGDDAKKAEIESKLRNRAADPDTATFQNDSGVAINGRGAYLMVTGKSLKFDPLAPVMSLQAEYKEGSRENQLRIKGKLEKIISANPDAMLQKSKEDKSLISAKEAYKLITGKAYKEIMDYKEPPKRVTDKAHKEIKSIMRRAAPGVDKEQSSSPTPKKRSVGFQVNEPPEVQPETNKLSRNNGKVEKRSNGNAGEGKMQAAVRATPVIQKKTVFQIIRQFLNAVAKLFQRNIPAGHTPPPSVTPPSQPMSAKQPHQEPTKEIEPARRPAPEPKEGAGAHVDDAANTPHPAAETRNITIGSNFANASGEGSGVTPADPAAKHGSEP